MSSLFKNAQRDDENGSALGWVIALLALIIVVALLYWFMLWMNDRDLEDTTPTVSPTVSETVEPTDDEATEETEDTMSPTLTPSPSPMTASPMP